MLARYPITGFLLSCPLDSLVACTDIRCIAICFNCVVQEDTINKGEKGNV
jgi:hypothetical protein